MVYIFVLNITQNEITKHQFAHMFSCDDAKLPEFLARFFTFWRHPDAVGGAASSPVKRIPTSRAVLVHTSDLATAPAPLAAMAHLVPDARPFAPPAKGQPAALAYLGRQICFLAHFRHCALPSG